MKRRRDGGKGRPSAAWHSSEATMAHALERADDAPETTVTGPRISLRLCFVKRLTRLFMSVLLPTPGGPTTATTTGGGSSSGVRSTRGTWSRVWSFSALRRPCRLAFRPEVGAKA
jgi:hypothetical protein